MADCYWEIKEDRYIQCTRCSDVLMSTDTTIRRNCPRSGLGDWVQAGISAVGLGRFHCQECQQRKELLDDLDGAVRGILK